MTNVLGLITARGGSKGIPNKNIVDLAGLPLLSYTARAARESTRLTRVVLSTDSEAIATCGRESGIEVPFARPAELARDDTPSIDVAQHALAWLKANEGWRPEVLVLLQPTSPLRRAEHIDAALEEMDRSGADTVVSVVPVPHSFHPYSVMMLNDNSLQDFLSDRPDIDRFRRQNLPPLYARNGPAVLASRVEVILEANSFYGKRVAPYHMSEEDSVDIDTNLDLWIAEQILTRRRGTV